MNKQFFILLCSILLLTSCEHQKPAFRFSNFNDTPAEKVVQAIKQNDTATIREEIQTKKVDVDFRDKKYEISLLALALANDKKNAFDMLLELGANPNIENSYCGIPLNSAIRYHASCDLYFIEKLVESGALIMPRLFERCNYYDYDPIIETVLYHYQEDRVACGLEILKLLTSKLDTPNLLSLYNDEKDYHANIIYRCLTVHKNIPALKYLIVDLGYKVPEKIYIDGAVLQTRKGYYTTLRTVLEDEEFYGFERFPYIKKAKQEILAYLDKQGIK